MEVKPTALLTERLLSAYYSSREAQLLGKKSPIKPRKGGSGDFYIAYDEIEFRTERNNKIKIICKYQGDPVFEMNPDVDFRLGDSASIPGLKGKHKFTLT